MPDKTNNIRDIPTFYEPADVPALWTLYDIAFWIAFDRPALADYDQSGIEGRGSSDDIGENMDCFGERFAGGVSLAETIRADLGKAPWEIEAERDAEGKPYLFDPEFYKKDWTSLDDETQEKFRQDRIENEPLAIAHAKYTREWKLKLDDYLAIAFSKIFIALREGSMTAIGLPVPTSSPEGDVWDVIWDFLNDKDLASDREKIGPESWRLKDIGWKQSWLWGTEVSYLAIVVPANQVFDIFPVKLGEEQVGNFIGEVLYLRGSRTAKIATKKRGGRPTKDWAKVNLKITELIAKEGYLPAKQSALAGELAEWYQTNVGEKISRSAVMEYLRPFYKSDEIQKR